MAMVRFVFAAAAFASLAMACGSTKVTPEPEPDPVFQGEAEPGLVMTPPDAAQVEVTLTEWVVQPSKASVPGGPVYFLANNVGQEPHELVVIKTVLAPEDLPVDDEGRVPEDAIDLIGEIEPFAADSSGSTVLDLEPGSYVLICNILEEEDDGTKESHYQQGMRTAFTVE